MKPSAQHIRRCSTVVGTVLLAFAAGAAALDGQAASPVVLGSITVDDSGVLVCVSNGGTEARTGTVVVRLATPDGDQTVSAPFLVPGGQKVCVRVAGAPSTGIDGVIQSGIIIDDGSPI